MLKINSTTSSRNSDEQESHHHFRVDMLNQQIALQAKTSQRIQNSLKKQLEILNQENSISKQLEEDNLNSVKSSHEEQFKALEEEMDCKKDILKGDIDKLSSEIEIILKKQRRVEQHIKARKIDNKLMKTNLITEIRVLEQDIRNHELLLCRNFENEVQDLEEQIKREEEKHAQNFSKIKKEQEDLIFSLNSQLESKTLMVQSLTSGVVEIRNQDFFSNKTNELELQKLKELHISKESLLKSQEIEITKLSSEQKLAESNSKYLVLECSKLEEVLDKIKSENAKLRLQIKKFGVSENQKNR